MEKNTLEKITKEELAAAGKLIKNKKELDEMGYQAILEDDLWQLVDNGFADIYTFDRDGKQELYMIDTKTDEILYYENISLARRRLSAYENLKKKIGIDDSGVDWKKQKLQ